MMVDYGSDALDFVSMDLYGKSYDELRGETPRSRVWSRIATIVFGRNNPKGHFSVFNKPSQITAKMYDKIINAKPVRMYKG